MQCVSESAFVSHLLWTRRRCSIKMMWSAQAHSHTCSMHTEEHYLKSVSCVGRCKMLKRLGNCDRVCSFKPGLHHRGRSLSSHLIVGWQNLPPNRNHLRWQLAVDVVWTSCEQPHTHSPACIMQLMTVRTLKMMKTWTMGLDALNWMNVKLNTQSSQTLDRSCHH